MTWQRAQQKGKVRGRRSGGSGTAAPHPGQGTLSTISAFSGLCRLGKQREPSTLRHRMRPGFPALSAGLLALLCNLLPGEDLAARLDAALAAVPGGGEASVAVSDADRGEILYARGQDHLLSI